MKPVYEITPERLKALSPAARALAEDAIRFGIWALVEEKPAGK
jgi:hypothetical protein